MFVAIITLPSWPASSTIVDSLLTFSGRALSTSGLTPCLAVSIFASVSLFSTLVVPTSTGRPTSWNALISSTIASHLSLTTRNIRSSRSRRCTGRFVGIDTTSSR